MRSSAYCEGTMSTLVSSTLAVSKQRVLYNHGHAYPRRVVDLYLQQAIRVQVLTMASYTYRYNEHGAVVVDGRACPPLTAEFATQRAAEARHTEGPNPRLWERV